MGKRKIAIVICLAIALICVIVIGAFLRTVNLTVGNNDPTKVSNTHVHTYLTEAVSATCSYGGYILHICDCGDFYKSNECEPLNHEYSAWEIIQAATADNEGIKAQRCLYCNKCNTESIPKVEEHKHIYEDQIILPTCIDRGYTLHACTICDYIVADTETDALGHSWSSWKVMQTEFAEGSPYST